MDNQITQPNSLDNEFKYVNKTLVLLPGSFKPPHKGHWQMVLDNLPIADEIHIFISNTSKKHIAARKLSKTNLKQAAQLKQKAIDNDLMKNQVINSVFKYIDEHIETITYTELKEQFNKIIELTDPELSEYITEIKTYLEKLEKTLFKSIRFTSAGTEIQPEDSLKIWELFINEAGLQNKVFAQISSSPSPMLAAVGFANNNCTDCDIFIGSHTEDEASEREKQLNELTKAFSHNPTNKIHLLPKSPKIQAARDIRENINNLNKNMFPDIITEETYNQIKKILTPNIHMENITIKKDKFNLLFESFMSNLVNEGRKCI